MKNLFLVMTLLCLGFSAWGDNTEKVRRKTQKVEFDSEMIEGQSRQPDGSYVVQKRGVDFVPLYKVRESFDENIKRSAHHLK
jgi:hypothetical protein